MALVERGGSVSWTDFGRGVQPIACAVCVITQYAVEASHGPNEYEAQRICNV